MDAEIGSCYDEAKCEEEANRRHGVGVGWRKWGGGSFWFGQESSRASTSQDLSLVPSRNESVFLCLIS